MKIRIIVLLIAVLHFMGCDQSTNSEKNIDEKDPPIFQFILVRHAEKEAGDNPGLTADGSLRANRLRDLLAQESITAIFSTDYKRTIATVTPLSQVTAIPITTYAPKDEAFLPSIFSDFPAGGLFVVVGHSNTIPELVNQLLGTITYEQLDDSDYNDIFLVTTTQAGKGSAVQLTY